MDAAPQRQATPQKLRANRFGQKGQFVQAESQQQPDPVRFGFMLALLLVVGGRVVVVQGLDPEGLASTAVNRRTQSSVLASERAQILDSNGTVLVQSIVRYDIVGAPDVSTASDTFKRHAGHGVCDG